MIVLCYVWRIAVLQPVSSAVLPRETFDCLVSGLSDILDAWGVKSHSTMQPHVETELSQNLFPFLSVEVGEKVSRLPEKFPFTENQLNDITLEWAFLLTQNGIKGLHYKECLNAVRASVIRVIVLAGYKNPRGLLGSVEWREYPRWGLIAAANGISAN